MTSAALLPPPAGGVLVASPNLEVRDQVIRRLERHGQVHTASGGAEALAKLEKGQWQMLFLDRRLPDLDAEELVAIIERRFPGIRVVMVDSVSEDWQKSSSTGWLPAPHSPRGAGPLVPENRASKPASERDAPLPGMIGEADAMREVYRMARLVARRETTVLITGPTGSGKDLVARAIHQLSPRAARGFSVLNCAAIPEGLVESELFGYARGAFTGAAQNYAGRILAAHGGTLFLDEIGDLPLPAQSKLLRFLEQKEIQRLGSAETATVDVRVIAATNQDLAQAMERGRFREDLYFRLSAFPIRLVPLAQRGSDLLKLAAHFLGRLAVGGHTPQLDTQAARKLQAHCWPGNVRELQQVLERAVIHADGPVISPEHVWFSFPERRH